MAQLINLYDLSLVMYPFSYSCDELPAHAEDLIEAALGAAKANKQVHGMTMATGSACELLYSYVVIIIITLPAG